ncbi:MAG: Asp23/Gls24 family envelope stress response protein [Clostridia bacterium]|nr:Asp23/Gls24 family envelope stress response protein [Clostridia bacterium]
MLENKTELSVSDDVLEKMAEIATREVAGVADLAKKTVDIKGAIKSLNAFKAIKVQTNGGTLSYDIYVVLNKSAKLRETVSAIQEKVKNEVQTSTGIAVTKVNVTVADIFDDTEKPQPEEEQ